MKLPKSIFLDWYKTLSHGLFWEHMADNDHPLHQHHSQIVQWLFVDNKQLINPWMRGEYSSEDICALIASDLNLSVTTLVTELERSCRNMQFYSDEIPGLLKQIKQKGIKVVIATDNMDTFRRFTVPGMKLDSLFDDFLISSELGVLKEDIKNGSPLFFDAYLMKQQLNYKDVVLLDDSTNIISTYHGLGLKILEVDQPGRVVDILKRYAA